MDLNVEDALHCSLVYSTEASAIIKSIDVSRATSSHGVVRVFTGADIPAPVPRFGSDIKDYPILADGRVLFYGQPVAAIVAETERQAHDAVREVKIEYEAMRHFCSFPDFKDGKLILDQESNVEYHPLSDVVFTWGDIKKAMSEKHHMELAREYEFPMVYHFPIERYGCIATPDIWDNLVIRSPTQHPFVIRRTISECLGLPLSKVIVEATSIGGGFGGKGYPKLEPLAGYLALCLRRPISIFVSTNDGFYFTRRIASKIRIKTGFDSNGSILYQDMESCALMGAFSDAAPRIALKSSITACGPYRVPNTSIRVHRVYSNTTPATAFRGFGMPQFTLAIERQMDCIAHTLGIDPLDVRIKNLPSKGESFIPIESPADGEWRQVVERAADLIGWKKQLPKGHGRGIAIGLKNGPGGVTSQAIVRLHADGSVTMAVGTTEMGQGSSTVLKQIAADILGIPIEKFNAIMGNTSVSPFDVSTAGSRGTVQMGRAVQSACYDVLRQIKDIVQALTGVSQNNILVSDGQIKLDKESITFQEILKRYYGPGLGEIVGKGYDRLPRDNSHPMGGKTDYWCFSVSAVELCLEQDTGEVNIIKCVSVLDAGKAINPAMVHEQTIGGTVMALGHSLMEKMSYDIFGKPQGADSVNYRICTMADVPTDIQSEFVENYDGSGPGGSKGIGESSTLAVTPAIAEAIYQVTGIELTTPPFTSEAIWKALSDKKIIKEDVEIKIGDGM
jgi:CO/xanthine dehydrogenase Mo-binding subunit